MQSKAEKKTPDPEAAGETSEFWDALRKGFLLGAGVLVLVLPPIWIAKQRQQPPAPPVAVVQPAPAPQAQMGAPSAPPQQQQQAEAPTAAPRLADFGAEMPTPDARLVANWAAHTRDHGKMGFVVIDKKDAHIYVFDNQARLKGAAPILLGKAKGDHTVPGIGDRPLSQVLEHEKTTPAGRFIAEPGRNLSGEDIIWVDYDAAVSMHRIRKVKEAERRYERLASETKTDNRISFGCVNVPIPFYNEVLDPSVKKMGAVVYVLPEVKTIQEVFGAFDVTDPAQLAAAPKTKKPSQPDMVKVSARKEKQSIGE